MYKSDFGFEKTVNLMYLENKEKFHYILIQCLTSFLKTKTKQDKVLPTCQNCFRRFSTTNLLAKHWLACFSENRQYESMPEDISMKFKNYRYRQPNIFTVYAGYHFYLHFSS